MKLVKEYINEKFIEDSDPIKDLGIGIGDVVELKTTFPKNEGNPHYKSLVNLIERGCFIGVKIRNKVMMNIYKELQDIIVPFFQNTSIYSIDGEYIDPHLVPKSIKKLPSAGVITHICTHGRYDINYSNTWVLKPEEIEIAKNLYKGKNNEEYPFFLVNSNNEWELVFIISKSGKFVTLVIEGEPLKSIKKYFKKPSRYFDYYLGEWKKPNEIIQLVKNFYELTK